MADYGLVVKVECGDAAQFATINGVVEGESAMHGRAVVVNDEIVFMPGMAVDEFALCRVFYELPQ